MGKSFDTFISIVHSHAYSSVASEFVDFHLLFRTIISFESDLKSTRLLDNEVSGFVLISKSVSANDDGFLPSWDESGDVADNNRLSEDSPVENISDGAVGTLPHFFEIELFDSGFVGSDSGALDSYLAVLDSFGGFDGDFIISGISVFNA